MEGIKYVRRMTDDVPRERRIVGNCVYYELSNGNRAKVCCYDTGVFVGIINKMEGDVDSVRLPFRNYFEPTQCSVGAPIWYQRIENGRWRYEQQYSHVLPKDSDYKRLAEAIDDYIGMFE